MKAVRLFAPGDVRCVEVEEPRIEQDHDVIVKVKSCGVCGSDIPRVMVKGTYAYPITVGHEFSGQVHAVGKEVRNIEEGDLVTVMPLVPCLQCEYCQIGRYVLCDDYQYYGSRLDGAMAEYIRVTARNVLKLPTRVDYEAGAMTDPAAIALHAVRKAGLESGQIALVIGLGPIGLFAVQWLKTLGAGIVLAVDIFEEKLELAKTLGADFAINGNKRNLPEAVAEYSGGKGADAVFEMVGNKGTQLQALQAVRKMGTVVYCGISYDDLLIPVQELNKILRGELILKGAWNSSISPLPVNEWAGALKAMDSTRIKTAPLISHRFALKQCREAFQMMYRRDEVFNKVMFYPERGDQ